jgi:phosphoenolpyruvate carboxykinase (ATP)
MHQAGPFNPSFDAERFGLKDLKSISYNFEARVSLRMRSGLARRLSRKAAPFPPEPGSIPGARKTTSSPCPTGSPTMRSGGTTTKATTPQAFDTLYADMLAHAKGMQLYSPLWRRLVGSYLVH